MMTDLTRLQRGLLTAAAAHSDGSLLPAPANLSVAPNRARKAAGQLVAAGFAEVRQVEDQAGAWREDGDTLLGAFINDAGREQVATAEPVSPSPARQTRTQLLIDLLRRADGASIDEVIAATDWQAHTARAAITILKNSKGHIVERLGERGASRYRIVEAG